MARAEGFEPPNAWTKTMCLTTWRRPNKMQVVNVGERHLCFGPWTILYLVACRNGHVLVPLGDALLFGP